MIASTVAVSIYIVSTGLVTDNFIFRTVIPGPSRTNCQQEQQQSKNNCERTLNPRHGFIIPSPLYAFIVMSKNLHSVKELCFFCEDLRSEAEKIKGHAALGPSAVYPRLFRLSVYLFTGYVYFYRIAQEGSGARLLRIIIGGKPLIINIHLRQT